MNCKAQASFRTFDIAEKAGWKIASAEVGVGWTIITLCPDCNSRSMFDSIVEAIAKGD